MTIASDIQKFENLKVRAKKLGLKIEFVCIGTYYGSLDWFAIGSKGISNFQSHVDKHEDDGCKVATFKTIEEVAAFVLSREMLK